MLNEYIATVRHLHEDTTRKVSVKDSNPLQAHKQIYMTLAQSEEIEKITDSKQAEVFQLKRGFTITN